MNLLLALLTAGVSGAVGVAQLRAFRTTGRTWRLLVSIAAFCNSGVGLVILVLLLAP